MEKNFKSGFAAIVGMPNVGKSTLLNTVVGQKIAIISDKPRLQETKSLQFTMMTKVRLYSPIRPEFTSLTISLAR